MSKDSKKILVGVGVTIPLFAMYIGKDSIKSYRNGVLTVEAPTGPPDALFKYLPNKN